jgi:hypothetical protein
MSAGNEDARPMMADAASASFSRGAIVPAMLSNVNCTSFERSNRKKGIVKGCLGSVRVN